ncbi:hypothetical protein K3495_g16320, partial [Podosphaera aphanis]
LNLPLLSKVRVWREKQGWQGPYTLLSIEDEGCILQLPHGPRRFRSTAVKPYHDNDEDLSATPNDLPDETEPGAPPRTTQDPSPNIAATDDIAHDGASKVVDSIALPTRRRGRPRKSQVAQPPGQYHAWPEMEPCTLYLSAREQADILLAHELRAKRVITTPGAPFEASIRAEIDGLIARGVFVFVKFSPDLHKGIRIFHSRIVNEVKDKNSGRPYEKSRLVIQGYADEGKDKILTQSPTIQRASQRLILSIAPTLLRQGYSLWLRDITQAYTQSATPLQRTVLAYLPTELRPYHPDGTIIQVI